MHKFFTPKELINDNYGKIVGEDVKHITKVLRLREGEKVVINDLAGTEYFSELEDVNKLEVTFRILEKCDTNNESNVEVILFQGLPKAQKMDLIVQKGTELGIREFVPVITSRVDVKLKGEFKKLDRLNRIALEAAKQSKRTILPTVSEPIDFEAVVDSLDSFDIFLVPYESAENFGFKTLINKLKNENVELLNIKRVGILVGPEGGFEAEEIEKLQEKGAHIITLGKRILRTETAGFVATSLVQYELSDLGGNN